MQSNRSVFTRCISNALTSGEVTVGSKCEINIPLDNEDSFIAMEVELVHKKQDQLGLKCLHIDLDSITHLRRLVELNLGDSQIIEQDFIALCEDNLT